MKLLLFILLGVGAGAGARSFDTLDSTSLSVRERCPMLGSQTKRNMVSASRLRAAMRDGIACLWARDS